MIASAREQIQASGTDSRLRVVVSLALVLFRTACQTALAAPVVVPPPVETPVQVIVSGNTSTLENIKIVNVGQEVPPTYAGPRMKNTPGFTWYVSSHYALKSDMDPAFSHHVLEISELAYPHWVQVIGREPPDRDDKRMCIVYARDIGTLEQAVETDLASFWKTNEGGGVTLFGNRSAYNYPSGGLMYHKRDLIIHEDLHMLNFCVSMARMPHRWTEWITYPGANHVYDEQKKQLTVAVFDKATVNNPIDVELEKARTNLPGMQEMIDKDDGARSLYTQFFWNDPDRLLKWRIWRDELLNLKQGDVRETDKRLMNELFGPIAQLDVQWRQWVAARHNSFHFVDWGWEQSGDMLISYGWPWHKENFSQTTILYAPSGKVAFDPLRMDYPAEPMPPTVGPVKRGVDEPTVGCVVGFGRWQTGRAGMGLGIQGRDGTSLYAVVIDSRSKLVVRGHAITAAAEQMDPNTFPLPADLVDAAKSDGWRFGVTMQIKKTELSVTLRAGKQGALRQFLASVPINPAQRQRMLDGNMAVISKDGRHEITPYIDDARRPPPDLTKPAPANLWRYEGLEPLYGLYKAAFHLGRSTPASLNDLKATMLAAADKDANTQALAMAAYNERITRVLADIRSLGPNAAGIEAALSDILGTWLALETEPGKSAGEFAVTATLYGPLTGEAEGNVSFAAEPEGACAIPGSETVTVSQGGQTVVRRSISVKSGQAPFTLIATAKLTCRGEPVTLSASHSVTFK